VILFKYGGHAISDGDGIDPTLQVLAKLIKSGEQIVIVHGGGPAINRELEVHGVKSEMIGGFRKTTPEVFEVVQRTLCGEVLRKLVNQLISLDINAIGITAGDGELTRAKIANPDLGLVGELISTNPKFIQSLLESGMTPVISPLSITPDGVAVNMNADLVAGAIGGALEADNVLFATDVAGIYRNWPDQETFIAEISVAELITIAKDFQGGMIPKAAAAINAISSGASSARIFDGRDAGNIEPAIAGNIGTLVVPK
jgi:acetylglutamate kinase